MDILNEALRKLKRLEGEIERLKTIEKGAGVTDHGALSGLGDDDHPQYLPHGGKWSFRFVKPASDIWYKLATLPISSLGTSDSIRIDGVMGHWTAANVIWFSVIMGNRDGFNYKLLAAGKRSDVYRVRLQAFQRATGETDIYLRAAAGVCTVAHLSPIIHYGLNSLYDNPPSQTTTPSGTIVFDIYTATVSSLGLT